MKAIVISMVSLIYATTILAQIPQALDVRDKITKNIEVKDEPQVFELADIKIVIPTDSKLKDQECMVLIHSDRNLKDMHEAASVIKKDLKSHSKDCPLLEDINLNGQKLKDDKWNLSFHFGFTRTFYNKTDMRLKSDRIDVTIKDFEFDERTSSGFYNPANWEQAMDAFRWIDEPTNHFVLTAEKNGHSIILSVFHPKFLKKQYQYKHVVGTVDGVAINDFIDINEEFDGYNNQLGEMYLVRFENTHLQMAWQVGYGYEVKVIESEKYGTFSVRPAVLIGVMSGQNLTVYIQEGEYWEFDDHKDRHRIQGPMASVGLRVNYKIKNFNFFVDGKYSYATLKHGFGDPNGFAKYDISYKAITFGIGYTIPWNKKKKKSKRKY